MLLPTWRSTRIHREVLEFACGLADYPEPLLEFIAERGKERLQEKYKFKEILEDPTTMSFHYFGLRMLDMGYQREVSSLLEQVWAQLQKPVSIEPLNNKFANVVTSGTSKLHVPSRLFLMRNPKICDISFNGGDDSDNHCVSPAECVLLFENRKLDCQKSVCQHSRSELASCEKLNAVDALKIVQQIELHQEVSVSLLCMYGIKIHSSKETDSQLKLSRDLGSVCLSDCCLSSQFYANLTTQLYSCKHIKLLELTGSPGVPREISGALSAMSSLLYVDLSRCHMTNEVSGAVMSGLSHCCQLQNVNLSENTLRNCLENLIPKSSHGYTCLRRLDLSDSKLSNVDIQNLRRVLQGSTLGHLFAQ